jgi:ATP-dependent DNA ligase
MNLPFSPPIEPMLAKLTASIPQGDGYLFEPKWDGFRAVVFRDGDEIMLQSRDRKPLDRYFPELAAPIASMFPPRAIIDGEIILMGSGGLDFEALQQRIHPAKSRVAMLAEKTPASFVAFDLLALGDRDLRGESMLTRREALEQALRGASGSVRLTPATRDPAVAQDWFDRFEGAGLDGVIAKPIGLTYQPKKRAMLKIKHARTADCVVAGFRWHKNGPNELVGSLLLGLYDDDGTLHHTGITSSFKMAERKHLAGELAPLRDGARESHPWAEWATPEEAADGATRMPGGQSRWSRGKDHSWEPLRIERVCEVKYDFMQGDRFRHATTFVRWRPDKAPEDCRYDQLEQPTPMDAEQIWTGGNDA